MKRYLAVALVGLGAFGVSRLSRKKKAPTSKPPEVPLTEDVYLDFASKGEDFLRLKAGDRIFVRYDTSSPFAYNSTPTDLAAAIETLPGRVGFLVTKTLPTGGVEDVYVQARNPKQTIEGEHQLVGEHKIVIMGP